MALMVYSGAWGKLIHKKTEVENLMALSLYFKTFKKWWKVLGKDSRSTKFVFTTQKCKRIAKKLIYILDLVSTVLWMMTYCP